MSADIYINTNMEKDIIHSTVQTEKNPKSINLKWKKYLQMLFETKRFYSFYW